MKKDIHPEYHKDAVVTCACGNVVKAGSTKKEMHVEICSACHPFYTGKSKVIDTTGRVDRFKKLAERASAKKTTAKTGKKKDRRKEKKEKK